MENNRKNYRGIIWYTFIFVFMYIWFAQIHPLVVFDADDWLYIASVRPATPSVYQWNPAKILPELLMPLCGGIAVYVVMPIVGDYLLSFTLVSAVIVALSISLYVYCFGSFLKSVLNIDEVTCKCSEILFLLFHFLVFLNGSTDNQYMFYAHDLNCYYNYVIPGIFNSSLVMLMLRNACRDELTVRNIDSPIKKGIVYTAIYFAVFSNLADSHILAIFCGISVLSSVISSKKFVCKEFLKKNEYLLLTLVLWIVSAVYEISGARAAATLGNKLSFVAGIKQSSIGLVKFLIYSNRFFAQIAILIIVVALVLFVRSRNRNSEDKRFLNLQIKLIISGLLALVYTILLCAKVNAEYITRSDYLFGVYFYGLLILMLSLAYVLKKKPAMVCLFPLMLCIVAAKCNTSGRTFKESNILNLDPRVCMKISQDLLEQVVHADQNGNAEMLLHVLKYDHPQNWPQATYSGDYISGTLYEHGMVSKRMSITVFPEEAMNEKYHIGLPNMGKEFN